MKRKLFIFDMGGVVVHNCSIWKQISTAYGFSDAQKSLCEYSGLIDAASRGNITSMESLEIMASRAGLPQPEENYWLTFFHPSENTETIALIKSLREKGHRVVCGTNTIDVHTDYLKKNHLYDSFDKLYASNLMGQIKPDITFWDFIRKEEKDFAFDEMFFFDDLQENVAAAASLGIHAHVFTSAGDASAFISAEMPNL